MNEAHLTGWIDGEHTPLRRGAYQRDCAGHVEYSYWSGSFWHFARKTAREAAAQTTISRFQQLPWRGLNEWMPRTL
jgi:hypothetical protein